MTLPVVVASHHTWIILIQSSTGDTQLGGLAACRDAFKFYCGLGCEDTSRSLWQCWDVPKDDEQTQLWRRTPEIIRARGLSLLERVSVAVLTFIFSEKDKLTAALSGVFFIGQLREMNGAQLPQGLSASTARYKPISNHRYCDTAGRDKG
ncbi:hypothetical protein BASA60_003115 [Batrachochytrium salamandrivorans]|nr:hypothetical protein BASA60_003115 [Batrachochytrium salamandrivorans]